MGWPRALHCLKYAPQNTNFLLPNDPFRVVPAFPRRARVHVAALRAGATVQETGVESEGARLVVPFPLIGVPVRRAPAARRGRSMVAVAGLQRQKVPLLHELAVPGWTRHDRL